VPNWCGYLRWICFSRNLIYLVDVPISSMIWRNYSETAHLASAWGPAAFVMAAIFFVSGLSSPPVPSVLPDVGLHAVAYTVLGASLLRGLAGAQWSQVTIRNVLWAVLLAVAYGATDEWHQSFVPGRTPELRDLFADFVGSAFGASVVWLWGIVLIDR